MGEGITSMYDITVISIIVAAIVALVKEYGGIEFILNVIKKRINGPRGGEFGISIGEFGISILALLVDCCTANNTVAIVMSGPIAKEISEEFDVSPRRSASLLDIFASVGQGIIPYGAQLLTAAGLSALSIAKEISEEFDVSPRRSASLLDIFASVGQGIIPYGAQLLTAAGLSALSPVQIMPYLFYPILMGVSAVLFILFRRRTTK